MLSRDPTAADVLSPLASKRAVSLELQFHFQILQREVNLTITKNTVSLPVKNSLDE